MQRGRLIHGASYEASFQDFSCCRGHNMLHVVGLGMALNSSMRICARVQIPVCPEPPLVFSHELLGGLRTGFLVVSPLRIACVFLLVERARSSKRVWRRHRIVYLHCAVGVDWTATCMTESALVALKFVLTNFKPV
jgi:hypothetical protein